MRKGLTLIEIMLVLIILSIVLATLGRKIIGAGDKAKRELSEVRMTQLKSDIEQFQLRYNSIPKSLDELIRCPEKAKNNCMPIITDEDSLNDAFGNKFAYTANSNRSYTIKSYGADGKDGGSGVESDIIVQGP